MKGLTTMIGNLENDKAGIEKQIADLRTSGEEMTREKEARLFILQQQLQNIEKKIEDKQEKLNTANGQLRELGNQHRELYEEYEHLQGEINKVVPLAQERAMRDVQAQLSQMMIDDTKVQFLPSCLAMWIRQRSSHRRMAVAVALAVTGVRRTVRMTGNGQGVVWQRLPG